jgi:hypothetical protein
MLTMEMYFKRFVTTKKEKPILRRKKYGMYLYKLLEDSKYCMIEKFSIEI